MAGTRVATETNLMPVRVRHAEMMAEDLREFELIRPDSSDLPQFTAGAHVTVRVPNGELRKYSLCNDPVERDRYVIAVKREAPGTGGSLSMVDEAKQG